jgi:hypothetical protein
MHCNKYYITFQWNIKMQTIVYNIINIKEEELLIVFGNTARWCDQTHVSVVADRSVVSKFPTQPPCGLVPQEDFITSARFIEREYIPCRHRYRPWTRDTNQ